MKLTAGILCDFFDEHGFHVVKHPADMGAEFESIRLYYPGCTASGDTLYLADANAYAQIDGFSEPQSLCFLTNGEDSPDCAFVVRTEQSIYEVFSLLQEETEKLRKWDDALSEILLRDGSLQEILECSAPVLKAPCFLQDSNFYLLASWGEITPEENQFFYETLQIGRAPSGLFTQLLSMNPSEQPYASPKAISSAVKGLYDHQVLIADCCVDGVAALHFCLYQGPHKRKGLPDLIIHLMQRMEAGPSIRRLTSKSTDLHDELFSKIIDAPDDGEFTNICSVLGLLRYQRFTALCIEFLTHAENVGSKMTQLRALYPRFWFFRYEGKLFALMGSSPETQATDLPMQEKLLHQLNRLNVRFGCSLDHFSAKNLKLACRQAMEALSLGADQSASYQNVMVQHMIDCFFADHPFDQYCPEDFQQMLEDDENSAISNLTLLHTFLANNCNATAVSRILHMHRNNVLYRIEKIKANYHFDLTDGAVRLLLQVLCQKAMMDFQSNGGEA